MAFSKKRKFTDVREVADADEARAYPRTSLVEMVYHSDYIIEQNFGGHNCRKFDCPLSYELL